MLHDRSESLEALFSLRNNKIIYKYGIIIRINNDGRRLFLRRTLGVLVAVLSLLAGLPVHFVDGQVYQASASPVAPQWIKPSSGPVAIIGINLSQNSGEKLQSVSVNITDDGGSAAFTTSDLAPLAVDPSSGVGLYIDNKTGGTCGVFDSADTPVALSAAPQWTVVGSTFRTTLKTGGTDIPTNDLGNNSGPDFFVAVRTSALASQGQNFSAHLESGDVRTDGGAIVFAPADTGTITVDDENPTAVTGADLATDEGVEVGFSGAGSYDNIGIANYTWLFSDFGPDSESQGVYVTHTFNSPGKFIAVLNVTDYAGNSDESTVLVTVRAVNHPPVMTSSAPLSAVQGTTYIYLMQAYDGDGDTLRYFKADGPTNLTINSTEGLTVWTPGPLDVGSRFVSLAVTDDRSPPARQSFWITVENVNDPPFFTSLPVLTATQNQPYIYKAEATDPDNNEQLVFSLVAGPRGMTIGPYTGVVSWTPVWDQVSTIRAVIAVSDRQYTAYQDFCITVANTNDPPVFNSFPPTSALQGVPYTYQVNATDPDGDDIRFFLNPAPAGMRIEVATGLVTWTPSPDQVGTAFVRLEARDIHGGRLEPIVLHQGRERQRPPGHHKLSSCQRRAGLALLIPRPGVRPGRGPGDLLVFGGTAGHDHKLLIGPDRMGARPGFRGKGLRGGACLRRAWRHRRSELPAHRAAHKRGARDRG